MADGINAKYTKFIAHTAELDTKPLKNKQEAEEAKTGGGRSIWNIYAAQDANQNEYITKQESSQISEWKGNGTTDVRSLLNQAIDKALETFSDNKMGATMKNNVFAKLSGVYIEKFAQIATNILNNFQGLNVGSEQVEVNVESEAQASDINSLGDQTDVQIKINALANKGIEGILQNFNTNFAQNIQNTLDLAQKAAEQQIKAEMQQTQPEVEYKEVGQRQVNNGQQTVYKKGDSHYIKNGEQYEEIFLVNDNGKNKYVTYDVKAQLDLQGKEGDISTKKVKVNGMDGEQNLIRNEGEKVGGHKTYSGVDGNQYIRSNDEYFAMGSDEGVLLQNGGHAVHERNEQTGETTLVGIKYDGKTYAIGSQELKEKATDLKAEQSKANATAEAEKLKTSNGVQNAKDLVQEQVTKDVTAAYNKAIAELGETTEKEQAELKTALEADIKATLDNVANNYATITTNTESTIESIKDRREINETSVMPEEHKNDTPIEEEITPNKPTYIKFNNSGPRDGFTSATLEKGQTVGDLAKKYNMSLSELANENSTDVEQLNYVQEGSTFWVKDNTQTPTVVEEPEPQAVTRKPISNEEAQNIGKEIRDEAAGIGGDISKMKNTVKSQITSDNVVEVWDNYQEAQKDYANFNKDSSILSTFTSEVLSTGNNSERQDTWEATIHIIDQLKTRAEAYKDFGGVPEALEGLEEALSGFDDYHWVTSGTGLDSDLSSTFEGPINKLVDALKYAEATGGKKPTEAEQSQTVTFKEKNGNYTATIKVNNQEHTITVRSTSMSGIDELETKSAIKNLKKEAKKLGFTDPDKLKFQHVS